MMLIIQNGSLHTMENGCIEGGSLVIADGKIIEIGKENYRQKYPQAQVIEAAGAFVMPGIIEAHCHMGITEEKKGMEGDDCNETVHPITPALRAIDAINPMDAAFADAVRAGITSAMIGPGSVNVVGGQFAFVKTSGRCIDDLIVLSPAAMKVAFGENPKVNYAGQNKSPATRMAIAQMLREELYAAIQYRDGKRTPKNFHYESWLPVLEKKIPLKAHVHRADDIYTAIRIAKEFDLRMTLDHCSEGHLIAEDIAAAGYPAIVGPDLASRSKIEVQNMAFKTAGLLAEAGVMVAITTDHPVSVIQYLPLCAGLAVKAGLAMEEGLRAITINAAKICGVEGRVGSLAVGKDADIAIFTANPMEIFTETLYTIIDGNVVYKREEA